MSTFSQVRNPGKSIRCYLTACNLRANSHTGFPNIHPCQFVNKMTKPLYPFHVEILETADLAGGGLLERLTQNLDGAHLRRAVHILVYDVQNH